MAPLRSVRAVSQTPGAAAILDAVRAPGTTLTAAASALVRPVLARPVTACDVVAASRTAVHVATSDPDLPVLSVVTPRGARLPGACVLAGAPAGAALALAQLGAADHLLVGDGTVGLPDLSVVVRRWWSQPVVRVPDCCPHLRAGAKALSSALVRAARAMSPTVIEAVDHLSDAIARDEKGATRRAVHAMVGLGPGLTPAADDVLVGALLSWHHLGLAGWPGAAASARTVLDAATERLDRTTAVSAALLHHASHGCSVPEALVLLDALRTPPAVAAALEALVDIGHDTGSSVAYGVLVGARANVLTAESLAR